MYVAFAKNITVPRAVMQHGWWNIIILGGAFWKIPLDNDIDLVLIHTILSTYGPTFECILAWSSHQDVISTVSQNVSYVIIMTIRS